MAPSPPPGHDPTVAPSRTGRGPVVLGVVAGLAHLVPGYLSLVSGLIAPLWAVVAMVVVWALLAWALVVIVRRRSWWSPVVPLAGMAFWVTAITVGENVLGWTA